MNSWTIRGFGTTDAALAPDRTATDTGLKAACPPAVASGPPQPRPKGAAAASQQSEAVAITPQTVVAPSDPSGNAPRMNDREADSPPPLSVIQAIASPSPR